MRYTSHFGVIKLFNFEFMSFHGCKKLKGGSIPESVCVGLCRTAHLQPRAPIPCQLHPGAWLDH